VIGIVVVLGTLMVTMNATSVNIAMHALGQEFRSPVSTIQWVLTGYMLAFASAIPVTGWACERFGVKRVWLAALLLFTTCAGLSGAAWSADSLIVFRVVQGIGGGLVLSVGQAILARAAGPQRMGRTFSLIGLPLMLGPAAGPVVGGFILASLDWRWIFLIHLPLGLVAIVFAVWLLPKAAPEPSKRPDLRGLILLSSGVAIFIYATSLAAGGEDLGGPRTAIGLGVGAALLAAYVVHARIRADRALIDLALLRERGFAAGVAVNLIIAMARSGGLVLLPLYWQVVRGEGPLETGFVLVAQMGGSALALALTGWVTDRMGAASVVPVGIVCFLLGTAVYTQAGGGIPVTMYVVALFAVGFGIGAVVVPATAAAYATLPRETIPRGTSALLTVQRLGDSIGTAGLAVVLQLMINSGVPQAGGPVRSPAPEESIQFAPALAHAFGQAFWVVFALAAITLLPALLLPRGPRARAGEAAS
jgi:EmrB/QacA subfamily drug resistance transporter